MKKYIFLIAVQVLIIITQVSAQQLEVVAQLDVRPGNVAVARSGRIFATIHPLGSNKLQLIEITGKQTFHPFPDSSYQKNGGAPTDHTLDSPLGLVFDKNEHLWVIDMGMESGKTRLWCFDINKKTLLKKIELPASIAPKGSFVQDLAIDEQNGWAYLADIANPGIIAVNLKNNRARRFSDHPSLQSENIDMVIDGKVTYFNGKPARVGINPITLSADRETLFFGAMNGETWYSIDSRLFRDNKDDTAIAKAIRKAGTKPISDGAGTDNKGNHYFTNLPAHAISKLGADGKLVNIIEDKRLNWPDNLSVAHDGWIYISVNQLNTTPAFTGGNDAGHAPYYIYKTR